MFYRLLIVAFFVASVSATSKNISFTDCAHDEIKWVEVTPCSAEPCTFKAGSTATIRGQLTIAENATNPRLVVKVSISSFWIDLPGFDNDGCKYAKCPVVKGQLKDFTIPIEIKDWFGNINTEIRFSLYEERNEKGLMACAKAPIVVTDSKLNN